MSRFKILSVFVFIFIFFFTSSGGMLLALTEEDRKRLVTPFYDPTSSPGDSCTLGEPTAGANTDYAGRPILTDVQLSKIREHQSFYESAAETVDIPWQMLAVVHLRETGLSRTNPSNGQGIYQFFNKSGGPYPTGEVSDEEFQRQTNLAAEFLKNKARSANLEANKELSISSPIETIKDTFFSYNGRARAYKEQAESLGFNKTTEPYEGSPYVMNKADSQRDPDVNPTGWGQIKSDGGTIEYPANGAYGAFVIYASIAGISTSCGSSEFTWPQPSTVAITSCFGPRIHPVTGVSRPHRGVDMVAGEGSPIVAAADGVVVRAGNASGYGPNFVVIEHDNGFGTSYGHMGSMSVNEGDRVSKGQQIGTEGNEGIGTGSHLHFNLFPGKYEGDSNNINPLQNGFTVPDGVANPKGC